MEVWPPNALDFSDDANVTLQNAQKEQVKIFLESVEDIIMIFIHVYDGREIFFLAPESWSVVKLFVDGPSGCALVFQSPAIEIEVRRRPQWGFRISAVRFPRPTIH